MPKDRGHGAVGFTNHPPQTSPGRLVLENIVSAILTRFDQRLPPADEEGYGTAGTQPALGPQLLVVTMDG